MRRGIDHHLVRRIEQSQRLEGTLPGRCAQGVLFIRLASFAAGGNGLRR
jgi:hypothetical protein